MFIAARFILGVGIEFCIIPAPVLTTELAYPTHRAKLTSLFYTFYFAGAILSSWTTFGTYHINSSTWSWRIPSILQLAFPGMQFIALFWVPESPRWLVSKGRLEEARAILVTWHANGVEDCPLVDYEMNEIQEHLRGEANSSMGWADVCHVPFLCNGQSLT
jgi:MFS family permease